MRSRQPRRAAARFLGRACLLFLGLTAAPARADYRQDYLDGLKEWRGGDLESAARALRAAIAEQPTERARARLVGVIPEPYLPHHYLGLVHFAARRCPEALAELRVSESQGAIAALAQERAEAERRRAQCESLARARQAIAAARTATESAPAGRSEPPAGAVAELAAADQALAAGVSAWDFDAIARAGAQAGRAAGALETWLASATAPAPGPPAATPAAAPPDISAGGAPEAPSPAPPAPASAPEAAPPANVEAKLPPALMSAVQSYFDGEYQDCVTGLRALSTAPGTRARFFQSFFRGAALHALYLLAGARDADLLVEAREDLRAARRADPRFTPTSADFSPRLIDLYRELR